MVFVVTVFVTFVSFVTFVNFVKSRGPVAAWEQATLLCSQRDDWIDARGAAGGQHARGERDRRQDRGDRGKRGGIGRRNHEQRLQHPAHTDLASHGVHRGKGAVIGARDCGPPSAVEVVSRFMRHAAAVSRRTLSAAIR